MALKKFGLNDVITNTMKAHPKSEFFIFSGSVFYNNRPALSGAFNNAVLSVSGSTADGLIGSTTIPVTASGFISLYEYNIDKSTGLEAKEIVKVGGDSYDPKRWSSHSGNLFSYPYITKDSAGGSFKSVGATSYANEFTYGDTMVGKYPMSASITRELMSPAGQMANYYDKNIVVGPSVSDYEEIPINSRNNGYDDPLMGIPKYRHYWSLRNRLNFYGARSKHYRVTGSWTGDGQLKDPELMPAGTTYEWIKDQQTINMISVPSIFYGSRIYPGSVSLRWYFTGSLIGELRDLKQNGELIQLTSSYAQTETDPNIDDMSGSVAGVVLYEEGIILLTGSWALNGTSIPMRTDSILQQRPAWIYFGAGANDGANAASVGSAGTRVHFNSASFGFSLKGETDTQVVTMFANARRGQANYSSNPTFIQYGQEQIAQTSSQIYEENSSRLIKNTVSSSYAHQSASFERQVYISRVALYDSSKNLIGVATLANPVLKKEDEDLTFKLRLDI